MASLGRWNAVDPLAEEFAAWTPYHYVHNNPILLIDPDGRSASSPIFGTNGELLGSDGEGWTGEAIVMDEANFTQGMDHAQALESGTELGSHTEGIRISKNDWNTVGENGGTIMTPSVVNNSDETIFFKPETKENGLSNGGAYPITPNSDLYVGIDGVAAPHISNEEVYKAAGGVPVTVTDTEITTNPTNAKQRLGSALSGWRGRGWNKNLNKGFDNTGLSGCCGSQPPPNRAPDNSWKNLFKKL